MKTIDLNKIRAENERLKAILKHEAAQLLKARCCIEDAELDEMIRQTAVRMVEAAK